MSILLRFVRRLMARLQPHETADVDPDMMPLRDWADLPAHHPLSDRAPC